MTFDNEDELYKIKSVNPNARLIIRILTDDSKSKCRFGVKFGASIHIVPRLLQVARELNLNVIGVSFQGRCFCCHFGISSAMGYPGNTRNSV